MHESPSKLYSTRLDRAGRSSAEAVVPMNRVMSTPSAIGGVTFMRDLAVARGDFGGFGARDPRRVLAKASREWQYYEAIVATNEDRVGTLTARLT